MDTQELWEGEKNILVILAHPDDPEFFMGATIARWTSAGHQVQYCLLTRGEKGSAKIDIDPLELARIREQEQVEAGRVLGVRAITFQGFSDGCLQNDLDARKEIVKLIRQNKPDVIVTSDPTQYFVRDVYINHPDHRAAGSIVIDAIFPASGNPLYYPELLKEGLLPHSPSEVWLALPAQPNIVLDVTDHWELKIKAILCHQSQVPNPSQLIERQRNRRTPESSAEHPRYEDRFRRLKIL